MCQVKIECFHTLGTRVGYTGHKELKLAQCADICLKKLLYDYKGHTWKRQSQGQVNKSSLKKCSQAGSAVHDFWVITHLLLGIDGLVITSGYDVIQLDFWWRSIQSQVACC